jgi:O-succinylbenzoic acid--CoA ligase
MDISSQRELKSIGAEFSITQVTAELTRALSGSGPAVGFGNLKSSRVPEKVAVVIGTSGSTGLPKEVGLSETALRASAKGSNEFLGANSGDIWSLLLPLTHIAGVNVLVRSLELGSLPIDLRNLREYPPADFTAIVPTQLFRALNGDTLLLDHLQNCRAVLVGGAALADGTRSQAVDLGVRVVSTYGMTETSGGCVYDGRPLNSVIVGTTPDGAIKIKGPILATTYLNDPHAWEQTLRDGWFITQDHGIFKSGKLIVQGRIDDVIVSGGEKISLTMIETAISSHYLENEFAAFTIPDPEWGNALYLAIAGNAEISVDEVSSYLAQTLGKVAKPKGFLTLAELPFTSLGKIDRIALARLAIRERKIP